MPGVRRPRGGTGCAISVPGERGCGEGGGGRGKGGGGGGGEGAAGVGGGGGLGVGDGGGGGGGGGRGEDEGGKGEGEGEGGGGPGDGGGKGGGGKGGGGTADSNISTMDGASERMPKIEGRCQSKTQATHTSNPTPAATRPSRPEASEPFVLAAAALCFAVLLVFLRPACALLLGWARSIASIWS